MASSDCMSLSEQVSTNVLLNKPFKCDFCPFTFQMEDDFNAHVLEHFVKKNCTSCNKLLIRIGSQWYELHVDELKDESLDDQKDDLELDSILQINIEKLDDELDFNTNSSDHDINFDNEVNAAPQNSSDPYAESHKKIAKPTPRMSAKSKKRKKSATQKESPSKQEKSKTEKPTQRRRRGGGPLPRIKCRICERIILKHNFEIHLLKMHVPNVIVTKEPVRCDTCGKGFANAGNLKIHQTIHSGTRRFVCSYCGSSFRQLYHLSEHINAHTGATPYKCELCDKKFTRHNILKAHQLVHSGEKPNKCNIDKCDRAYAYEIDLKRHKFSAHGIYSKKHICTLCEKVFPEKKLLRKHLESHSAGNIRLSGKNNV